MIEEEKRISSENLSCSVGIIVLEWKNSRTKVKMMMSLEFMVGFGVLIRILQQSNIARVYLVN